MKQYRFALILAVLLAALAGVAYWDEWKTAKETAEEKDKNKLVNIDPSDVTKVDIKIPAASGEATHILLERSGDDWALVEPMRSKADTASVKNLLQTISDYKYETKITDDKSKFAQYGLDPAARTIEIATAKNQKILVLIGAKASVGYNAYIATSQSNDVYIGSQHIFSATEKKVSDFRDRTLVTIKPESVVKLTYRNAKGLVVVARKSPSEEFRMEQPQQTAADKDTIEDFISGLSIEKVEDFVDVPDAKVKSALSSSKNLAHVDWELSDATKGSLDFAELNGKLYVQSGSSVYTIGTAFKSKLERESSSFVDKTVVKFTASDLESVEVDGEIFLNDAKGWIAKADKKAEVKSRIASLLTDLEFAKAEHFLKPADVKNALKDAPKHSLLLSFKDSAKQSAIKIDAWPNPKGTDSYIVKSSRSDSQLFEVKKSVFANAAEAGPETVATPALAEPPAPLNDSNLPDAGPANPEAPK